MDSINPTSRRSEESVWAYPASPKDQVTDWRPTLDDLQSVSRLTAGAAEDNEDLLPVSPKAVDRISYNTRTDFCDAGLPCNDLELK